LGEGGESRLPRITTTLRRKRQEEKRAQTKKKKKKGWGYFLSLVGGKEKLRPQEPERKPIRRVHHMGRNQLYSGGYKRSRFFKPANS